MVSPGRSIELERPNDVIAKFDGALSLAPRGGSGGFKAPVTLDNLYMRGTTVRSVDWVAGAARPPRRPAPPGGRGRGPPQVVNTGPDTKIYKSNRDPPLKESSLILAVNRVLKYVVGLLAVICLTGGVASFLWMNSNGGRDAWYLAYPAADARWAGDASRAEEQARVVNLEEEWYIKFFYYFLLMAQFVPVSLYARVPRQRAGSTARKRTPPPSPARARWSPPRRRCPCP